MAEELSDVSSMLGGEFLPGGTGDNNASKDEATKKAAADKAVADKVAADKIIADKAAADKAAAESAQKALTERAKKLGLPDNSTEAQIAEAEKKAGAGEPEAVEIDGVKYKLDNKGNALDNQGNIFKTKDELDLLAADDLPPLAEEIIQKVGLKILDDKGQPKKYPDTIEGVIEATKDIAAEMSKKGFQDLLESDPEFKEFFEYKRTGGKLEDFINVKTSSWSSVKLDEGNENQLISVVMADLMASGIDEEQAKITAEMYKDTKRLKEFGKAAFTRLVNNEKEEEKVRVESFKAEQEKHKQNTISHWTNVKNIISKGVLDNIEIPEADKEPFYQYLAIAVDDKGNSKRALDVSKLPIERLLQLDYLLYKEFKLDQLITKGASTQRVLSLRKRLGGQENGLGGGQGINKNNYKKPDFADVSLENIQ